MAGVSSRAGSRSGTTNAPVICELPDDVTAAALAMAIAAGGAIKSVKTTPLMTFEDGIKALQKAKAAEYAPPASEIPYFGVCREGS